MHIPASVRERSTDWVLQFINIVFLLLLYFLVNGSITEQLGTEIELPVATATETGTPPQGALYIDRSGTISLDGESTTIADAVTRLSANGRLGAVTVAADRMLQATRLIGLLDVLKANGAGEMTIITITGQTR